MKGLMASLDLLIKDFKGFVARQPEAANNGEEMADGGGHPYVLLNGRERKEKKG